LQGIGADRGYVLTDTPTGSCETRLFDMLPMTGAGKRRYVSNSLLSTLDHSARFTVRLIHIGPDGMQVDPFFNIGLNKFPTGPPRGHDMLIN
jgi:selenium-binding protein 1